jgi:hypothetical protein
MALLYSSRGQRLVSARYEAEGLPRWSQICSHSRMPSFRSGGALAEASSLFHVRHMPCHDASQKSTIGPNLFGEPILMMSQNRQAEIDRRKAEIDYRINIKAELEIEQLHQKIDCCASRR